MKDPKLTKRAVAAKGWQWLPGMKAYEAGNPNLWTRVSQHGFTHRPDEHPVPDLSDPATLGCLLALVREYRVDPYAWVRFHSNGTGGSWCVYWNDGERERTAWGASEAEALIVALDG